MTRCSIHAALGTAVVLAVLRVCLFGDSTALRSHGALAAALAEITAILRDPGTQWMVFVCAGLYLLAFAVLRFRLTGVGKSWTRWNASLPPGEVWLAGLVVVAALAYALQYPEAVKSTQALTLVGAAMMGQAIAFWER